MYKKVKNELRRQALQKTPRASGALASAISEESEKAQSPVRFQPLILKRTAAAVLAVFIAALAVFGTFRISANLPEIPSSETPRSAHGQIGLIVVSAAGTDEEETFSVPAHPESPRWILPISTRRTTSIHTVRTTSCSICWPRTGHRRRLARSAASPTAGTIPGTTGSARRRRRSSSC